jgi:LAO/AO transport system kinase
VQDKIKQILAEIQAGSFRALARGITLLENELPAYEDILLQLRDTHAARVLGITGPPGAGKSTLVNALLHHWIQAGKKIAVIAVDPSSPFNYGALLGDRIRMSDFYNNPNVYIRSLASRGALGGLHPKILEITDLVKNAPFDFVLVETVGVGQSEVEVAGLADCTVVALVPEAGDEVQTIKAGIMEVADIFVVNKADRDMAETLYRNLRILVHERAADGQETPVVKTVATQQKGVEELAAAVESFFAAQQAMPEKRLHLLTEKTRQLIQAYRMRDISNAMLTEELRKALQQKDFNLYRFARKFFRVV